MSQGKEGGGGGYQLKKTRTIRTPVYVRCEQDSTGEAEDAEDELET